MTPAKVPELWPPEALEAIHAASLAVLARAGVKVESARARELLAVAGCRPGPRDRLLVPKEAVEAALAACPPRFTLVARAPERSLAIDSKPGAIYVHNMGGARDIADPITGADRRATWRDQAELSRVMHHLVHQHTITPLVQPDDVPSLLEPLYSYLIVANETDKYLGGPGISHSFQARYLLEMAVALTGATGEGGRYPLDLAFSPVSPLLLGAEVTDALVDAAARGHVVIEILPCPAAGTTAPASIAAAVAQQNAEVLAGVVLVQAVAPGTPVYYGPRLSSADPRSGLVVSGSPETAVSSVAATLLARRYGLACDCYGPSSDSKVLDTQFGYEHMVNAVVAMQARPRFLSGVGDVQAGVASSVDACVIDDEILHYAFYAIESRPYDDDALDVEAIVEGVLSGRGFLGTKHTRRYMRSDLLVPFLSFRGSLGEWLSSGTAGLAGLARERAAELVSRPPLGLPADVGEVLCSLIDDAARETGAGEGPDPRHVLAGGAD